MRSSAVVALAAVLALLLGGCGKSAQDRKAEADLNDQIMKGHEVQMAKADRADSLGGELEARIAANDSLVRAFPKETAGRTSGALTAARDHLQGSRHAMDSWMESHTPYNEGIKHDQAMAQLQSDLNALQQVGEQMETAIADATRVIGEQKQFEQELAAMKARKRR